jgi:hypothetical protein
MVEKMNSFFSQSTKTKCYFSLASSVYATCRVPLCCLLEVNEKQRKIVNVRQTDPCKLFCFSAFDMLCASVLISQFSNLYENKNLLMHGEESLVSSIYFTDFMENQRDVDVKDTRQNCKCSANNSLFGIQCGSALKFKKIQSSLQLSRPARFSCVSCPLA